MVITKKSSEMHSLLSASLALLSTWVVSSVPHALLSNAGRLILGAVLYLGLSAGVQSLLSPFGEDWSLRQLIAAIVGGFVGLIAGVLLIVPSQLILAGNLSEMHLAVASLFSFGLMCFFSRLFVQYEPQILQASIVKTAAKNLHMIKILDTNTIIDGRIAKLVKVRFVEGLVVVPDFILDELKRISDDRDELKKQRGRHALKAIQQMLDEHDYVVRYTTGPVDSVDEALLSLALELNAKIITSDTNLVSLAKTKNVSTININEISVACQMMHLRGERFSVKIVEAGTSPGQGRAYTEDGALIVIENGEDRIGDRVNIVVTRHLQSNYGAMLFAEILP